jgi:hypothetical protein
MNKLSPSFYCWLPCREWLHDSPGLTSLIFGAFGFPFGFTCIIVCGGELFTSMCAYTACAWWERKITLKDAVRCGLVNDGFSFHSLGTCDTPDIPQAPQHPQDTASQCFTTT